MTDFAIVPGTMSDEHEHGNDCGHTAVMHDDHVGHLVDGELFCQIEGKEESPKIVTPKKILVQHRLTEDIQCVPAARVCEGHGSHSHGPQCGHERVLHVDHYDYLVDKVLHHPHAGHCDTHTDTFEKAVSVDSPLMDREGYPSTDVESFSLQSQAEKYGLRRFAFATHTAEKPTEPAKKWYRNRDNQRFMAMFFLTGGYFFVELVYGIMIDSLALVADSLHMLTDVIALCVGFYSLMVSRRSKSPQATFGMTRMEVVGGLMNGCFLLAIAFTIVLEAIERIVGGATHDSKLEEGALQLIIVACVGLGINLIGMFIFGHGHSHGGHGHSHGGGGGGGHSEEQEHSEEHGHGHGGGGHGHKGKKKNPKIANFNMRAVFLHVMADAMGSVAVIISGTVIYLTTWEDRIIMDPICSLVIAAFICAATIPLIKGTVQVLLQKVPVTVDIADLKTELMGVPGVEEIHELHVWQLNLTKIIGTLHVILLEGANFMNVSDAMKDICHRHGIHSTSIQPEFATNHHVLNTLRTQDLMNSSATIMESCHDRVCDEVDCATKVCCDIEPNIPEEIC